MDEDGNVKAPITRLRRRLSVEAPDDTKSPAGTPTKKRGAKLAAKPQLDLIEENAIQNSPKRTTRKSLAKELVDTPAEKPMTPARRSTRIKSNTSLVSEPSQGCESPRAKRATARRNSQLGSDTESSNTPAQSRRTRKDSSSSIDKLAVETLVTPGKIRRTKREYTSVADEEVESKNLIKEVITEEPEIQDDKKDKTTSKNSSPNSTRKSPRLEKKERRSNSNQPDNESNDKSDSKNQQNEKINKTMVEQDDNVDRNPNEDSKKDRLSVASANLIKDLVVEPNKSNALNKSSSAAELLNNSQSKRQRTKSWTTLTVRASDNFNFLSDNEGTKKKKKNEKSSSIRLSKGSGDSVLNASYSNTSLSKSNKQDTGEMSDSSAKKKKNRNEMTLKDRSFTPTKSLTTDESNPVNTSNESNKENKVKAPSKTDIDIFFQMKPTKVESLVLVDDSDSNTDSIKQIETGDQCVPVVDQLNKDDESKSKMNRESEIHNNIFNVFQSETAVANNSIEPMEIDETITTSLILNDSKEGNESILSQSQSNHKDNDTKVNESMNVSQRKTSISNQTQSEEQFVWKSERKSSLTNTAPLEESITTVKKSKRKSTLDTVSDSSNDSKPNLNNSKSRKSSVTGPTEPNESVSKSKRKSNNTISISQDLEKSGNENKNTLVLSQIKDTSMGTNVTISIQDKSSNDSEVLSKTINDTDNKKSTNYLKISNDYMTSTPVQDKNVKNSAMQMNTSVITPTDTKKGKKTSKIPLKGESILSKDTDSSDEEDESKSKNSLVIDEAEDAGDDYQSGDSQDEEERQYKEENEIIQKGETLESDEDFTNESDYEKDSFVVSSDEEDNELLSGSGDDLGISDNELTMSAKSKKKFDEKAKKIQKKASREMFEARHNLDQSSSKEQSRKKNRLRLDSTQSSDEMQVRKKNKRMRLDTYDSSNSDQSITKSTDDPKRLSDSMSQKVNESATDEIGHKKKKDKRLSESICESEPGDDVTDSLNASKNKKKNKRLSESNCNNSVLKEHEITVSTSNENEENKEDPLLVNVKLEPKTPQKDLDITTVNITCREDVEQVHIDENTSMLKPYDTVDPLQSTIAENEDEDSDASSISENEDITNNYDSVLNELNKESSKKIKTNDISLDNNKKSKKKNDTIIEQLNITRPKGKITPKKHISVEEKTKLKKKVSDLNEDSSDSIDLKLLFSDDSNDSAPTSNKRNDATDESFIPLKRTKGKTNIRGNISSAETTKNDSLLNTSTESKNKDRKSSQSENVADPNLNEAETSIINTSSKKKKKNRKSSQSENATESYLNEAETSIINTSSKKKKKNRKSSQSENATESYSTEGESQSFFIDTEGAHSETNNDLLNTSTNKKQKLSMSITTDKYILKDNDSADDADDNDAPTEVSFMFEKNDKQTKRNSESKDISCQKQDTSLVKTPKSEKKKDKSLLISETQDVKCNAESRHDKKRKRSTSEDKESNSLHMLTESQSKNKKKKKLKISDAELQAATLVSPKVQKDKTARDHKIVADEPISQNTEPAKRSKKRKEREDDVVSQKAKIIKEDLSNKKHIPRLPPSILAILSAKPSKEFLEMKKSKLISTSEFVVEDTKVKRKNKPSNYLEESVYLNDDPDSPIVKKKTVVKKPKVLPFMPTVSTSDSGFTTKFRVNVLPQKIEFVAQANTEVTNFKNKFLQDRKMKKLRTYDLFKQNRHIKLSKY